MNPAVAVSGTGTFTIDDDPGPADLILSKAGWDWRAQGFLPGQTVTIYDYAGGSHGSELGGFVVAAITDDNPLDTFDNTELRLDADHGAVDLMMASLGITSGVVGDIRVDGR